MDRRKALIGIGSLGLVSNLFAGEELDDKLSSEIFLFLVRPTYHFPEMIKISYVDIEDNPFFDNEYFYTWITLDQLQKPGKVFNKILMILKAKYTAENLVDMLNIQLTPSDGIEFYRAKQGQIKAKLIRISGVQDIPQSISVIS